MKSAPLLHISNDVEKLESCAYAAGHQCQEKYTNHWDLDQPETNKNK